MKRTPIYLDYHASTPVDPRVLRVMYPYFTEAFGNASSRSHAYGWRGDQAVSDARIKVLGLIGARSPDEIVFTSGATESNNLAIRGVVDGSDRKHVVTSAIEHPCVLETCRAGIDHTVVPVGADGLVDPAAVEAAIRPDTALVSIMAVNNEVGTVQPIRAIAEVARRHGVLFHTDASQAIGRIDIDVRRDGIDLLSISAHKIYGPKGVGALYVRRSPSPVPLVAQTRGGGQERGLRAGTLNVPGIVGLGEAARVAGEVMASENRRIRRLRDRLLAYLQDHIPELRVHGSLEHRVAANLNVSFGDVQGDTFLSAVPELAISGGAACASGKNDASHVLLAMGLEPTQATTALRIALGRMTTEGEVEFAGRRLVSAANRLMGRDERNQRCARGTDPSRAGARSPQESSKVSGFRR